jgi:hypothetical protein
MSALDRSRIYPQAVEQLFVDHWPGFAEESNADRGFLTLLVINCYRQKRYRHSHYEGMTQYYCRVRDGHFGRGRFQEINARLHLFEVTSGYCKGSFTRGYALEPDAQSLIENLPLSPTAMVDPQGNVIRTPATYAIESKDSNGQTRKGKGNIPASTHVNVDALLELQREGLQWKWHYKG